MKTKEMHMLLPNENSIDVENFDYFLMPGEEIEVLCNFQRDTLCDIFTDPPEIQT